MELKSSLELLIERMDKAVQISECNHNFSGHRSFYFELYRTNVGSKNWIRVYSCLKCPLTYEIECVE